MKTQVDILHYPLSSSSELTQNIPSMKINVEQKQFAVVGKGYFMPCPSNGSKTEKAICQSGDGLCLI